MTAMQSRIVNSYLHGSCAPYLDGLTLSNYSNLMYGISLPKFTSPNYQYFKEKRAEWTHVNEIYLRFI